MNATVTLEQAQAQLPKLLRRAEKDGCFAVSKHGKTVGFFISLDRAEALVETLEIMGDPRAMKAIRDYQAGRMRFKDVDQLDED